MIADVMMVRAPIGLASMGLLKDESLTTLRGLPLLSCELSAVDEHLNDLGYIYYTKAFNRHTPMEYMYMRPVAVGSIHHTTH